MKSVLLLLLTVIVQMDAWSQKEANAQIKLSKSSRSIKSSSKNIDPVALNITFKKIKHDTVDMIKIIGIIKNNGRADFISGKGQQVAQLWEKHSAIDRTMVKSVDFNKLNSQEELYLVFERDAFTFNESLIPEYELIIVYDTDIYRDSNEYNNDISLTNNIINRKPQLGHPESKIN